MATHTEARRSSATEKFVVEVIKPSKYDDDGYVIQWMRAFIPSNSLACLTALAEDASARRVLGENVEIVVNTYDESHTIIRPRQIIRRIRAAGRGMVLLTGVQSNQFPRAADLAREFREAGIDVAIGGFHVSGCISMLNELPPEIKAVQDLGVVLFAGEAEGTLPGLLADAYHGRLKSVYNYLLQLPDLQGTVTPSLPTKVARRSFNMTPFDVGRGCPFRCSFCTIINVQGRKSRFRDADDVEHVIREYAERGVTHFFITDDNMARNKNWEPIFDRLIKLREVDKMKFKLLIQVDTMCHKIPNFIEKATRAGCNRVFIGMESINPENLIAAKKFQNRISEYRTMLQQWRDNGAITHAGYILGFPFDTPESIERDIRIIQEELPLDIIEFFMLTPLPGSADHKELYEQGVWMEPDMNIYDSEHATTAHPKMTKQEWEEIYDRAWHTYYSPEHVETLMRRAVVTGSGARKLLYSIMLYYGSYRMEKLHPLQCGVVRRKIRSSRRPGSKPENLLVFYAKRVWETVTKHISMARYYLELERTRRKVAADPWAKEYSDLSLTPVEAEEEAAEAACCGESQPVAISSELLAASASKAA